jgi:oligopeptidase A
MRAVLRALRVFDRNSAYSPSRACSLAFWVIETLFGVVVRADQAPTWHPEIRVWIDDARASSSGSSDLRASTSRAAPGRTMQPSRTPCHAGLYLTCNFARPSGGRPATFRHDDC